MSPCKSAAPYIKTPQQYSGPPPVWALCFDRDIGGATRTKSLFSIFGRNLQKRSPATGYEQSQQHARAAHDKYYGVAIAPLPHTTLHSTPAIPRQWFCSHRRMRPLARMTSFESLCTLSASSCFSASSQGMHIESTLLLVVVVRYLPAVQLLQAEAAAAADYLPSPL